MKQVTQFTPKALLAVLAGVTLMLLSVPLSEAQTLINTQSVGLGGIDDQVRVICQDTSGDYVLSGTMGTQNTDYGAVAVPGRFLVITDSTFHTVLSMPKEAVYDSADNSIVQWSWSAFPDSGKSLLVKLNASTGQIMWQEEWSDCAGLGVYGKHILSIGDTPSAICDILNPDGTISSSFQVDAGPAYGIVCPVVRADTLYVFSDAFVAAFLLPQGQQLWKVSTPTSASMIIVRNSTRGVVDRWGNTYICSSRQVVDSLAPYGSYLALGLTKYNSAGKLLWDREWTTWGYTYSESNMLNASQGLAISPNSQRIVLMGSTADSTREAGTPFPDWWNLTQENLLDVFDTSGNLLSQTTYNLPSVNGSPGDEWISQTEDGYFNQNGDLVTVGNIGFFPHGGWEDSIISNYVQVWQIDGTTGVKGIYASGIAHTFSLFQNYPNPFNPSTTISYQLPNNTFVVLKVFDVLGREVETLANEQENAGYHSVRFNGANLPSGVYFYRLEAGAYHDTKKFLLLK